jgi:transcription factor C subunit 6
LHPFIASGGADGSVRVSNAGYDKSALKAKKYTHKFSVMTIFRLDLHRGNGSFRMIENLALLPPMYRTRHGSSSTVAWDPAISQTCIRWNPNQDKEDWLVSGMACGLVRIDFVASL